jgi:hypothetical protein
MALVICSGGLHSGWAALLQASLPEQGAPQNLEDGLSTLSTAICRQRFPGVATWNWKPFMPGDEWRSAALRTTSSTAPGFTHAWIDANACLMLDFWCSVDPQANFLLFYSSPEFELSCFLRSNPRDLSAVEAVISAWITRTRAMFNFFMHHRGRCLLLNVESWRHLDAAWADKLAADFGLKVDRTAVTGALRDERSLVLEYVAGTLLLDKFEVSNLYNHVRSAATVICNRDKVIEDIKARSMSLIPAVLDELERNADEHRELDEAADTFASYLTGDPLLRLARHNRAAQ